MSVWSELRRRNVGRVAAAYGVLSWLLIQIAVAVFPQLNLPAWTVTLVIVLLLLGLPVVLLFAWVFEVTPDGIRRTPDEPAMGSISRGTGQKLNYVVTALLALAVGFLLFDNLVLDAGTARPSTAAAVAPSISALDAAAETAKTIAVLPFSNLSSDPEQGYFADGLSEELLNSLAQIEALRVTARTSSFTFKNTTQTVQQIGETLGVEHILEGSVRKAANTVRITAQLVRAVDGFHLWSETYDRSVEDVFAVQEEIAMAVAEKLSATFGITAPGSVSAARNAEAYALYLAARGQNSNPTTAQYALDTIEASLALDPQFAPAWMLKAAIHNLGAQMTSPDRVPALQQASLEAVRNALAIAPDLAAAQFLIASAQAERNDWVNAEASFRRAIERSTSTDDNFSFAIHLLSVGNFAEARELLEAARENDPLNQTLQGFSLLARGLLGDRVGAEEEYQRARLLFADPGFLGWFVTMTRLEPGVPVDPDAVAQRGPVHDQVLERIAAPDEALAWLRQAIQRDVNTSIAFKLRFALYAAVLGDPELALDVLEPVLRLRGVNASHLWIPAFREMRQRPRFKAILSDIGIVDHWNTYGWPEICRPLAADDFQCT